MMMKAGAGAGGAGGGGLPRANPEKSLEELTHQDIMQLTREDCRRYLKEKGMRRPSWNKSQAIQQVLSLKNLFHSTPDNGEEAEAEAEAEPEPSPSPPPQLEWLAEAELPVLATQNVPSTTQSGAQLTIFYSGNVNVYNDVPAEKAQAIMLLAGAANHLPCSRMPNPSTPSVTTSQQVHKGKETPVTRKASLQRFLEKKKDRGRCKTGSGSGSGSGSRSKKQPPMLMGMFMHPSYWSDAGKKKASKSRGPSTSTSPTRPPRTPSSDEQRMSMIENCTQQAS